MVSRDHFISLNKLCLYKNDVIWRVCPWFDIQIRRLFSIKAIFHPFVLHVLHLFPHLKLLHTFLKGSISKSFKPFLCCHWRLSILWRRVCGTKSTKFSQGQTLTFYQLFVSTFKLLEEMNNASACAQRIWVTRNFTKWLNSD